ncbi:MAG: T9SS type A sorting domain-containing protein [Chlorobi bacterium]|nr:T9SS type A sorting domain-containing protein [Chlorobiota bacterium]
MCKIKLFNLLFLLFAYSINAQLTNPDPEAVYGGRIRGMDAYTLSSGDVRLFISTESANSIFYADMSTSGSPTFTSFTVTPGVGDDDGYGSGISQLKAHSTSDLLFFITSSKDLLQTSVSSSAVTTVVSGGVDAFTIYNPTYLMYMSGADFHWGTLDASGAFTEDANSPRPAGNADQIVVNPVTQKVYLINLGTTVTIYESTDAITAFSATTNFLTINTTTLSATGYSWTALGFGPDGALFVGGGDTSANTIYAAYTEDDGTTWTIDATAVQGVGGGNFATQGSASSYTVYFAKCYAAFTPGSGFGSWTTFGTASYETHANDGVVVADPVNSSVVYITTDQGIGVTNDGGPTIFEIDDGVEAVQVKDFDMDDSKTTGYAASKSGIRVVTDYSTASPTWSSAIFPNGDGSGYFSAEMVGNNTSQAYVGNVRVYKTTDGGSNWTKVFTAENAPYSFPNVGSQVQAIEVCPDDNNIVLAGYYIQGTDQGGLFYSTDAGSNWDQILCKASTKGNDVDVYDIAFTNEGGNIVAYVGVYYDQSVAIADRGRSIYRCEWDGSSWTVRQDMDGAYTAVGYAITATIIDLETSVTGDSLFACGTDAGSNSPIAYYKILNGTNVWTNFTSSGFPSSSGRQGKAITVGRDTCYVAVDNEIYTLDMAAGTAWTSAYAYPNGTEINVLFYDDLLVGTGTGLYAQNIDGSLPVELTSFTADEIGDKVQLRWNTATEINNYGFEIQRQSAVNNSGDIGGGPASPNNGYAATRWETIGFVEGHGNSSSPKDYSFYDDNLRGEKIQYRLKQIDTDGSFEYFPNEFGIEVEIGIPEKFELFQNYPNPFSKGSGGNPSTTIKYNLAKSGFVSLKVYNVLGAEVALLVNKRQNAGSYTVSFNAAEMPSGVYFYALKTEGTSNVKKMILLR